MSGNFISRIKSAIVVFETLEHGTRCKFAVTLSVTYNLINIFFSTTQQQGNKFHT